MSRSDFYHGNINIIVIIYFTFYFCIVFEEGDINFFRNYYNQHSTSSFDDLKKKIIRNKKESVQKINLLSNATHDN
jgi:hypothetical protein